MKGVHARALHRAAEVLGGRSRLRELLRTSMRELDLWMAGVEKPPRDVFLKAVDIISSGTHLEGQASLERAQLARERAKTAQTRAALARERANEIYEAILGRRRSTLPKPASPLAFLSKTFDPGEGAVMIEAALDAAISATRADMGNVQITCPDGLRIVAQRGFEQPFLEFFEVVDERCAATCGVAGKELRRVVVSDVRSDPIFAGTPSEPVMAHAGVRAVQSTPLVGLSGKLHGMISTHFAEPRQFDSKHMDALDFIARRTAFWLDGGAIAP